MFSTSPGLRLLRNPFDRTEGVSGSATVRGVRGALRLGVQEEHAAADQDQEGRQYRRFSRFQDSQGRGQKGLAYSIETGFMMCFLGQILFNTVSTSPWVCAPWTVRVVFFQVLMAWGCLHGKEVCGAARLRF